MNARLAQSGAQTRGASAPAMVPLTPTPAQRLGNQHVQMLLQARLLQAKLTVNHPQDVFEQEADRVADHVMRMTDSAAPTVAQSATRVQRQCDCEEERPLQRSEDAAANVPTVDAATESSIQSLSTRGSALPESVRSFMEPRFNADFGAVRVHNDAHAHDLARAVSAQAFTVGRNVVFGAGHYAPDTENGKRLLAHELTHVVQQQGGSSALQRAPADAKRWARDDAAARYRGQVMAKRIRTHGKLSREAEQKIISEVAYFEGSAKAVYMHEVRPAVFAVGEVVFPGEELAPPRPVSLSLLAPEPRAFSDEQIYAGLNEAKHKEEEEAGKALAAARKAEVTKLETMTANWRKEDQKFALSLLHPLIQKTTNIDPRAISDRIFQPILDRYRQWLEAEDAFRKKTCLGEMDGLVGYLVKAQMKAHPELDRCRSWFTDEDSHGPAELRSLARQLRINRKYPLTREGWSQSPAEVVYWAVFHLRKVTDPEMLIGTAIASGIVGKATTIASSFPGGPAAGGSAPRTVAEPTVVDPVISEPVGIEPTTTPVEGESTGVPIPIDDPGSVTEKTPSPHDIDTGGVPQHVEDDPNSVHSTPNPAPRKTLPQGFEIERGPAPRSKTLPQGHTIERGPAPRSKTLPQGHTIERGPAPPGGEGSSNRVEADPAAPEPAKAGVTQPYPIIEEIGEYTFSSQKWDDGETAHWRIWNWARNGGPKRDKIDLAPLRFFQEVVARAKDTKCGTLELTLENIEADSVQRTGREAGTLWKRLGATSVRPIADRTIRVVIPLGGTPPGAK